MKTSDTSNAASAREHARSMAGTRVRSMPTIPAASAVDLPPNVSAEDVVWDETVGPGGYASHVLNRGTRLRIDNLEGDACVSFVAFNADQPIERLNVADTIKVQWNAYLSCGKLILSGMGRVLLSIVEDTCGHHDVFCAASNEVTNTRKYGAGSNHSAFPNARDRLLVALAKHGLSRKDLGSSINLFKGVRVEEDGGTSFRETPGSPGEYIELRAEMNVLIALANTPHVLDGRPGYIATRVRALAWRGVVTPEGDPIRTAAPEALRAFQNVDDYYSR